MLLVSLLISTWIPLHACVIQDSLHSWNKFCSKIKLRLLTTYLFYVFRKFTETVDLSISVSTRPDTLTVPNSGICHLRRTTCAICNKVSYPYEVWHMSFGFHKLLNNRTYTYNKKKKEGVPVSVTYDVWYTVKYGVILCSVKSTNICFINTEHSCLNHRKLWKFKLNLLLSQWV